MGKISDHQHGFFYHTDILTSLICTIVDQSWRKMIEGVYCPAPQPENYIREEDPNFREDPEIYIEFDDGVYYQASLDGSEVAIIADYPRSFPYSIVSVQVPCRETPAQCIIPYTQMCFVGSACCGVYSPKGVEGTRQPFGAEEDRKQCGTPTAFKEV